MKKQGVFLQTYFKGPQIILVAGVLRPHGLDDPKRYDIMPLCVDRHTAEVYVGLKLFPINGAN